MGLAGPDRAGDDDVLAVLEVGAAQQLRRLWPLDASERLPVELFEGLEVGEDTPGAAGTEASSWRASTSASSSWSITTATAAPLRTSWVAVPRGQAVLLER